MPVLQPFWFLLAAGSLVVEGMPPVPHSVMVATVATLIAVAAVIHASARSHYGALARTAGPLALIRWRPGVRFGITDETGKQWTLHFLPWLGMDLHVGDAAFAEGHQTRGGEFRAATLVNIRTGGRHFSRWTMSTLTATTCLVLMALVIVAPGS
ncbi:hypothetical protein [Nocardia jejuensis]|uniref:hypothetical protein n=1 Tax=Nocardia jejuensis TaxID=328049 RepID=UPI0012FA2DCC|nr:hypothetical protein [Nocardia jejuensis]